MNNLLEPLGPTLAALVTLAAAVLLGLALWWVLFRVVHRLTSKVPKVARFQGTLLRHVRRPLALLLPLIVVRMWLPLVTAPLTDETLLLARDYVGDLLHIGVVIAVGWLLIGGVRALEDIVLSRYDLNAADNLQAREVLTRTKILKRIAVVVIAVLALAAILMHYESFRDIGTGLLASAGVAGLVIGLAAQRTLGNILAGIQLAITQPIRVDDVVIVEGDFGWVEEITLTYVVVRVWDKRRIVAPISDFMEKPFQNWTRTSSDLLGTVFLYVDYTVPVEALREEHQRVLAESDDWDEDVAAVQVTDATERTVQVRFLQSARDAGTLFGLRCHVREQMIAFLQREYPGALPKVRAEMSEGGERLLAGRGAATGGAASPSGHERAK